MSGTWYDQYVYAQSFSTGTLSTLAPGPFVKNPIEVVIFSLIKVFCSFCHDLFHAFCFLHWLSFGQYSL